MQTKRPEVCKHSVRYPQAVLEEALLEKFERATSDGRLDDLCRRVNAAALRLTRRDPGREKRATTELEKRRAEAARLARAIASGGDRFEAVCAELERVQAEARALEDELRVAARGASAPVVHPELVKRHVAELRSLIAENLPRAKTKIARHLEGDLMLTPSRGDGRSKSEDHREGDCGRTPRPTG